MFLNRVDLPCMKLSSPAVLIGAWSTVDEVYSAVSILELIVAHVLVSVGILVVVSSGPRITIPVIVLPRVASAPCRHLCELSSLALPLLFVENDSF